MTKLLFHINKRVCKSVFLQHVVSSGVHWGGPVGCAVVELPCCVHVCIRLRPFIQDVGTFLLADEESSLTHQVHAVSFVEDSVYMESSVDPFVPVCNR